MFVTVPNREIILRIPPCDPLPEASNKSADVKRAQSSGFNEAENISLLMQLMWEFFRF